MILLYSLTLFLGAFLLFTIQPMIAKMVLPLLGGSPSVWNTCMVFFQAVLLAGYAYAHLVPPRLGARRHVPVHLAVLGLPFLLLPPGVSGWVPRATEQPAPWLLGLLLATVGAPAFALATTAPLLQRWFAASAHRQRSDPYFLYVASNLGSLAALLGYPLTIEPHVTLAHQAVGWAVGYGALAVLAALCAFVARRGAAPPEPGVAEAAPTSAPLAGRLIVRWIALALVPSSLMLGVTTYITTDVAPIPLFWVIPLALYLVTFIIAFARPWPWVARLAIALLPPAILALPITHMMRSLMPIGPRVALHLAAFFVAALVCHGELAGSRPEHRHLTAFYLWLALGGVLGGVLNALIAPSVFPCVIEYPLMFAIVALLRPRVPARAAAPTGRAPAAPRARYGRAWTGLGMLTGLVFLIQAIAGPPGSTLALHRNFFGVIRVRTDAGRRLVELFHGSTSHGLQSRDPALRDEPLGYFSRAGPIGQVFAAWDSTHDPLPVAVVGLGAGTLACYARPGQTMTFYEIDPAMVRMASDTTLFTYLADAGARGAQVRIVVGDGRLRLGEARERYGVLVLDAFSSDAIPVHLLTRQALRLYLDHLDSDGILAVHFSSRYTELDPELAALARGANLVHRIEHDPGAVSEERARERPSTRWVVMARSAAALGPLADDPRWRAYAQPLPREWTDDYSSLATLVHWIERGRAR